jgi:hypothetical protein
MFPKKLKFNLLVELLEVVFHELLDFQVNNFHQLLILLEFLELMLWPE